MHLPDEKTFTPAPAGAHIAICIQFIDLGSQVDEFEGRSKLQHKVRIQWELPNEPMSDGRPFVIGREYTWSMSDKAKLRAHLESWRGKAFTQADFGAGGFDTKKLPGVPCTLSVTHNDKGRAVIAGVAPAMKGVAIPKPSNPLVYFALDDFNEAIFETLPDWIKTKIAESPEYREIISPSVTMEDVDDRGDRFSADLDDEIPF